MFTKKESIKTFLIPYIAVRIILSTIFYCKILARTMKNLSYAQWELVRDSQFALYSWGSIQARGRFMISLLLCEDQTTIP